MKLKAYAKVNLCLNVVGKRPDGYHDLQMIMAPIDLYDTIEMTFDVQTSIQANRAYLPSDERNTIIKTINKLRERYGFKDQFRIKLTKNIPSQAGLGGGSADAAIMIKTLNRLLDLRMTIPEMLDFGKLIGADVPYCLINKSSLVQGIGDDITAFDYHCPFYLLLVKPKRGVSTKRAFEQLNLLQLTHPDARAVQACLMANDYPGLLSRMGNDLQSSAALFVPEIELLITDLKKFGFDQALMSGSGSTVFGITQDENLVNRAISVFQRRYPFVKKTKIIDI